MRTHRERQLRYLTAGATLLSLLALVACGAAPATIPTRVPGVATAPPVGDGEETLAPAPPSGTWTGTVTVEAVVAVNNTTNETSGDPGSTYYETSTTTEADSGDSADTLAITAQDQEDLEFGIDTVELNGSAATQGHEDYKSVIVTKKQNSGCTWTEEVGDENSGSWTDTGKTVGELRFNDDGSYSITIHASTAGPNGEEPEGPQIDHHVWIKNSDISAGCTGDPVEEFTEKRGPLLLWASGFLEEQDVNYKTITIEGQMNTANPGNTVDGTATWKVLSPEMTLTATWHLVHSGPIVLPHS